MTTVSANSEINGDLASELRRRVAVAALGGPQGIRERHIARGKLLPRERVNRLLDPGSPFLEIGRWRLTGCTKTEQQHRAPVSSSAPVVYPSA